MSAEISPTSLDHVALWVDERAAIADFTCEYLGMHVIEETDTFSLVGVDAKLGKLTLFDAEGPRRRGALERIALRVDDLGAALARLPQEAAVSPRGNGVALLEAPGGVPLALVQRGGSEYDLDHLVLRLPERAHAFSELEGMGFARRDDALVVGGRELRIVEGEADDGGRPLLNHVALLVESADEVQRDAERRGIEVDDVKDAPNTLAVFLRGPCGIRVEYVEHKPGFALV